MRKPENLITDAGEAKKQMEAISWAAAKQKVINRKNHCESETIERKWSNQRIRK